MNTYIGVESKARNGKIMYVGVNGVAQKVKKAYIGVNGVARLFFDEDSGFDDTFLYDETYIGTLQPVYYGTTPLPLKTSVQGLAAANTNIHALFAGGGYNGGVATTINAFTSDLERVTPTGLSSSTYTLAGVSFNNRALFAGGYYSTTSASGYRSNVVTYDDNLTREALANLGYARRYLAGAVNYNYAIFAGGSGSSRSKNVDAYSTLFERTVPSSLLDTATTQLAGTNVGNYAVFAGGYTGSYVSTVTAYDLNLQKIMATNLNVARHSLTGVGFNNYAMFAGGYTGSSTYSDVIDVYNSSLTRVSTRSLSAARGNLTSCVTGNYVIFAGGNSLDTVDVFDSYLTRVNAPQLSCGRYNLASAQIGEYSLLGGGYNGDTKKYIGVVDIYKTEKNKRALWQLPSGYTKLEWVRTTDIERAGKGFGIDTGLKVKFNSTRIVMDLKVIDRTGTDSIVSSVTASNVNFYLRNTSTGIAYRYSGRAESSINKIITMERTKIDLDFQNGKLHIGDESVDITPVDATISTNLFLFGCTATTYNVKALIYSCNVYENGKLVRKFAPCINPSGIIGFYDIVGDKFYPNAWDGEFVAGATV